MSKTYRHSRPYMLRHEYAFTPSNVWHRFGSIELLRAYGDNNEVDFTGPVRTRVMMNAANQMCYQLASIGLLVDTPLDALIPERVRATNVR